MPSMTVEILPPVSGRHQNHALAALRREKAVELRASGLTFEAIACELGYTSRATAYNVVKQAIEDNVATAVEELRALESARLDLMQRALWDKALAGDVGACRVVLALMQHRAKLFGLDRQTATDSAPRTVVIEPTVENLAAFIASHEPGDHS